VRPVKARVCLVQRRLIFDLSATSIFFTVRAGRFSLIPAAPNRFFLRRTGAACISYRFSDERLRLGFCGARSWVQGAADFLLCARSCPPRNHSQAAFLVDLSRAKACSSARFRARDSCAFPVCGLSQIFNCHHCFLLSVKARPSVDFPEFCWWILGKRAAVFPLKFLDCVFIFTGGSRYPCVCIFTGGSWYRSRVAGSKDLSLFVVLVYLPRTPSVTMKYV
jgi:hypothetical protein